MPSCWTFVLLLLASTVVFAAAPDRIASAIDSSQTVELARSLHPKAQAPYDQGPMDPQTRLSYVTLLTAPSASQQRALDKLLADQQDPASPLYHQWLTPEQYADRFGLSLNDVSKITAWLKGQGFTVLSVARGRNNIAISGTVAQFESAFQTQIHRLNVDGEEHFANMTPLRMPAALSGIVRSVRGLHNFHMKPLGVRRRQSGLRPDYSDSMFNILVAPGDIATIYDVSPLYNASPAIDGTGQKLAVVGQTDIYLADITDFRTGFGFSAITGCVTNTNGVVTSCNSTNFRYIPDPLVTDPGSPNCSDLSEADLDIEWSGATARNAQIIYVNSPATFNASCTQQTSANGVENALSLAIQQNVAPVISMSYGLCEAQSGNDEPELQQANAQGQTVVNSSGDLGAAACDFNPPGVNPTPPFAGAVLGQAVSYPASSPEVTGVGGTHIPLSNLTSTYWSTTNGPNDGTALSYVPEVAWNDDTELALFCQAHPTNSFCTQGGRTKVTGWVPLTTSATAQQVQQDIWISSGGGGPSNCFGETAQGVCTSGFAKPSWQSTLSVPGIPAQLSTFRLVPDVSLMASPNFPGYIICTAQSEAGGTSSASTCASGIQSSVDTWQSIIGGTSASAPIFAGIVTLLNQYLTPSSPGLGNINQKLYALAATPSNNAFHQVNTGNNQVYCQPGMPANQTTLTSLQCPNTGILGYDSAVNFDPTTHYNPVTGLGSVDVNNLVQAWKGSRSASSIGLAGAPTSVTVGQSVTLTATVTPSTATGSVAFYKNRTTALGTTPLTSAGGGVATFTWTPTGSDVGTDIISASYSGDGYNASADTGVAGAVTVTVTAPTFTFANTLNTPTSHTVFAGQQSLTYSFTATPTSSATFEGSVTLSCSAFAPTNSTLTASSCAFSPSATIAAGSGPTTVTMTITTAGPNTGTPTMIRPRADKRSPWLPLALPIAGVVMVGLFGRKVSKYSVPAGLCVSLVLLGLLLACGSSSRPISVTVTPATASLYPNHTGWPSQTQAFSASVANATNTAVTWSASSGTIDASGNYTAPTIAAGLPPSATITATSQASSSATGTATVTLKPATVPGTYTVTVTATEGPTTPTPLPTVALVVQ